MKTINLRVLYPDAYKSDYYVEVPDEVAEVFETFERMEKAYMQRVYYHKAYYTLDCSDEIEHSVVFRVLSPEEIYERKLTREQLHAAISMLPDKQAKRIYARYILGMSNVEIAKAEGGQQSGDYLFDSARNARIGASNQKVLRKISIRLDKGCAATLHGH